MFFFGSVVRAFFWVYWVFCFVIFGLLGWCLFFDLGNCGLVIYLCLVGFWLVWYVRFSLCVGEGFWCLFCFLCVVFFLLLR